MTQPSLAEPSSSERERADRSGVRSRSLLLAAFLAFGDIVNAEDGEAFYRENVFPILESNCFKCHGGGDHLKAEFRITSREGLLLGGEFGPAYDEENPGASLLLEMISYKDEDHQMPPKAKLSEEHIATLTKWVTMGAPYDPELEIKGEPHSRRGFTVTEEDRDWWAYRPVGREEPPAVEDSAWIVNAIDAFIKSQLEREGLTPNPEASPQTLVRRLYYDLIGLPPTPEEVEAFVAASKSDADRAYSELVEDLLARPQYGEKWARHWLDLVRYAETNGFERDNPKPHIWRYRDYVIDAFNDDKPYDEFVIEQLAGDEIEKPTMESMIATGYHRLMQWDDEPADRKQHVYDVLADNVQVTSETFLATTLGCARCHDHKADPVSQKDYYSFMAFFNGITHYKTEGTLVNWADAEEKAKFERERNRKLNTLTKQRDDLGEELRNVLTNLKVLSADSEGEAITFVEDARSGNGPDWFYTTKKPTDDWSDVGFVNKAWFKAKGGFGNANPPKSAIATKWDTEEIWMRTTFGLTSIPDSLILEIHHDEDVDVFLNGGLIYEAKGYTTDYEPVVLDGKALDLLQTGKNVVAVHCRQSGGGQYIDLALRTNSSSVALEKLVAGKKASRLAKQVKELAGRDLVSEFNDTLKEIANLRAAEPGTPLNVVTEKGPNPGPMNIHIRGSAHALGDEVSPGLPAVLSSEDSEPEVVETQPATKTSGRRLALANWIVDPENPLTARVMVNRFWQHHFGRGIVPSTSDFGQLGEEPTHPELLDWLATQFVENGWSTKAMHRLILHSNTYRMSSAPESANLDRDPQNANFWRYPMRRLTAEELRDSVLAVSGDLNLKSHGPWVFPPLPKEVVATASRPDKAWPVSKNEEDHYRRSLYVHVKRSLRHDMLADFDQADTDTTCPVRFATTVPTQALAMMNSRFVNDQAANFADRLRSERTEIREQIAAGLELALQRKATEEELDHLETLHRNLQEKEGLDPEEAMVRVALVTLNLNEFLYLD